MKLVVDLFTTDYGLVASAVTAVTIGMAIGFATFAGLAFTTFFAARCGCSYFFSIAVVALKI